MKKMRKIVPAFAMLMVAAIMLSTASFAWFSTNTTATAGGMTVQATTSGGLAIAFGVDKTGGGYAAPDRDKFAASATFNSTSHYDNGGYKLNPTSVTKDGSAWYSATAASPENGAANGGYSTVTGSDYYFATVIYVRSLAESAETSPVDLFVRQVTVSSEGTGTLLEDSLRVAVNVGTKWLFFAPNRSSGTVTDFTYVSGTDATGKYAAGELYFGQNNLSGADLNAAVKYNTPTEVNVYVYFDGEDPNCKSALAFDLRDLNVSVVFATEDYTSTP